MEFPIMPGEYERRIVIVDYDDEFHINNFISEGYIIREFFKDKCILQKGNIGRQI